MDLNTIKTIDRDVNLTHPKTGAELGLVFHLRAPDSDDVKTVDRNWQNKRLQPKNRKKAITSEELERVTDNRIKAAVKGWTWTDKELVLDGEQPKYSPKTLRAMMTNHTWIREFLAEECEDITSFF
jgi:hypothetical protein